MPEGADGVTESDHPVSARKKAEKLDSRKATLASALITKMPRGGKAVSMSTYGFAMMGCFGRAEAAKHDPTDQAVTIQAARRRASSSDASLSSIETESGGPPEASNDARRRGGGVVVPECGDGGCNAGWKGDGKQREGKKKINGSASVEATGQGARGGEGFVSDGVVGKRVAY